MPRTNYRLDVIRERGTSLLIHKSFQILNQEFSNCFRHFILPFVHFLLTLTYVIYNHIIIRFWSILTRTNLLFLSILLSANFIVLMYIFPAGAVLNIRSVSYLRSLRIITERNNPEQKRRAKSLRQIRVYFGDYIYLHKFVRFKTFGIIVYWTMRSLLMFQE